MMVDGQWQVMPGGAADGEQVNVGVAPFPSPEGNRGHARHAAIHGPVLIVPAGAMDRDAVAPLLAWMMSPAQLADAAYAQGFLPASRVAVRDPRFQQDRDLEVFLELIAAPAATGPSAMPDRMAFNGALAELEKAVLHQGAAVQPLVDEFQRAFALRRQEALGYELAP
jgi:ABC-type glycerol-3-phosphate transport system substrate-binding protein